MKLTEIANDERIKCLVYGEAGTGKTCFGCSFPTPIFVADFDGKINSSARFHSHERVSQIDFEDFRLGRKDDRPFDRFEKSLVELETASKAGKLPFQTVVVDSLTQYADAMLKELMHRNPTNRFKQNLPSQQDYHIFSIEFKNFLMRILALECNVVVTAHIQIIKDDLTGEILRMPQLPGSKLPKWLPVAFEEVYRTFTKMSQSKIGYFAQTQADNMYACRSQIPELPGIIPLSYNELTIDRRK